MEELKADLSLLQSDVYLLCGPVEFMQEIERGLLFFGVPETKIKREYFFQHALINEAQISYVVWS